MGKYGDIHIDGGDPPAAYTAVTNLSNLSEGVHPGYFCIADAGIIFKLDFLSTLFFNGLHFHGGTAPMYPVDTVDQPGSDVRINIVQYGALPIIEGPVLAAFGAWPKKEPTECKTCKSKDTGLFTLRPEFNCPTFVLVLVILRQ